MKISAEKQKMYESILQAFGPSGCEYWMSSCYIAKRILSKIYVRNNSR